MKWLFRFSSILLVTGTLFPQPSTAKNTRFRIAVMYSDPRSLDVKCAVDAVRSHLSASTRDLEIATIAYGDDPATLRSAATKIADEAFDVAIGPMLSHEVQMVGPTFAAKHIPLFLPIASNPDLTKKFPDVIRMISNSDHYAQLAAANALRSPKNKSILIITNQSLPYSRDYSEEFIKQLRIRQFKGRVTQHRYLLGQADFKEITKTIADTKADLIYAPIYSEDITSLYLSISDAKLKAKIFTHAGMFDAKATILAHYDPKILVQFNGIWDRQTRSTSDNRFLKSLAMNCDPTLLKPWTMAVWDALNLAIATHSKSPSAHGHDFVVAVRKMKFTGILGKWQLDTQYEPIRSLPVYSLQPKGTRLDTVIPASEARQTNEVE